jgi:signal transduction histidine kinase
MVRISDLIHGEGSQIPPECQLAVTPDMPVSEALRKMQELGCDNIVVMQNETSAHSVLTKEEVMKGLLMELDSAQVQLQQLQQQIEGSIADQIDMVQEEVRSLVAWEKDKLALAIDNMTEGLIILGRTGEIERANPSAKVLLGLKADDPFDALAGVIDGLGFREMVSKEEDADQRKQGAFKVRAVDHKILKMRWNQLCDPWGRFLGNVVTIRDITEEELAEKNKTEFIASISHELRTPLTTIQNSVSNILAGVTGKITDKTRDYLHATKSDCHRLADLINDLLDMAKLEAGSMPVNRRVMSIVSAVNDAARVLADQAHARNIELSCEPQGCISPVYADPQRIGQVVLNLIANAVHFTPPGGKVTVRTYDSGDNVVTMVQDTGIGIAVELQKQIFNKFYQVRREPGPGSRGSGLGLAICHGIIAVHGGAIWVESAEGQGSRFYFSLRKTDPFVMLYKHVSSLAGPRGDASGDFALMILHLDVPPDRADANRTEAGSIINELLTESDHFLADPKDIAIQTEDFEVVFVLGAAAAARAQTVKRKIQGIVRRRFRKNCGQAPILPMLGTGFYPADATDVRDLEKMTRRKVIRLF